MHTQNRLRLQPALIALLLCIWQSASGNLTEMRTWTDTQGRTLQARLISHDKNALTGSYLRADGHKIKIPDNLLIAADQELIQSLAVKADASSTNNDADTIETQSDYYTFSGLSKTKTDGYINTHEGWEYQVKALKAKVRYRGNATADQQYLKAYFYDRNNQLIQSYKQPARIQDDDGQYTNPPKRYEKNESHELYFPLSNFLEGRNWQRAIIVFGNQTEATAKIYPSGDLSVYAFPERKLIFGSNLQSLSSSSATANSTPTKFVINRARKSTFKSTAWVNGDWRDGTKGILVSAKVEDALPSGNYFMRVHYFDTDNKLIHTQKQPTQIEIDDAANTYTKLPQFAKIGRSHDAYFPFDKDVEAGDWRKAVVVFGNDQSVDLAIIGGASSDLAKLNFPEKAKFTE